MGLRLIGLFQRKINDMGNPSPNMDGLKPFEAGKSGNPAGKPKGIKSMKTILREMMELMVENPKGQLTEQYSKDNKISVKEMLVMQDIINAQKGNEKARQRIWEYLEGKPDQKTEIKAEINTLSSILDELDGSKA